MLDRLINKIIVLVEKLMGFIQYLSHEIFSSWANAVRALVLLFLIILFLLVVSYVTMQATRLMIDIGKKLLLWIGYAIGVVAILWLIFDSGRPCTRFEAYWGICEITPILPPKAGKPEYPYKKAPIPHKDKEIPAK